MALSYMLFPSLLLDDYVKYLFDLKKNTGFGHLTSCYTEISRRNPVPLVTWIALGQTKN